MNNYIKIADVLQNPKGKSIKISPSPTDTSAVQVSIDVLNKYVDKCSVAKGNSGGKK
jgi:hypothetical protein